MDRHVFLKGSSSPKSSNVSQQDDDDDDDDDIILFLDSSDVATALFGIAASKMDPSRLAADSDVAGTLTRLRFFLFFPNRVDMVVI